MHDGPQLVTVIFGHELRGNGQDNDPFRRCPALYTLDGELICRLDPWLSSLPPDKAPETSPGYIRHVSDGGWEHRLSRVEVKP